MMKTNNHHLINTWNKKNTFFVLALLYVFFCNAHLYARGNGPINSALILPNRVSSLNLQLERSFLDEFFFDEKINMQITDIGSDDSQFEDMFVSLLQGRYKIFLLSPQNETQYESLIKRAKGRKNIAVILINNFWSSTKRKELDLSHQAYMQYSLDDIVIAFEAMELSDNTNIYVLGYENTTELLYEITKNLKNTFGDTRVTANVHKEQQRILLGESDNAPALIFCLDQLLAVDIDNQFTASNTTTILSLGGGAELKARTLSNQSNIKGYFEPDFVAFAKTAKNLITNIVSDINKNTTDDTTDENSLSEESYTISLKYQKL